VRPFGYRSAVRTRTNLAAALSLVMLAACDLRAFTADSTADLLHHASPQFNTLEDLEFAEQAVPGSIATMEAVWRCSPRNQDVLIELAQNWTSYGFAFLEDHAENADAHDEPEMAEHFRARARAAYHRGREFGLYLLNARHDVPGGPEGRIHAGIDAWRQYLARFNDRDDVPGLFWTGNAWLSFIQLSLDDPSALLDLPFAMALIDRSRALNPDYFYGGAHLVTALYYSSTPAALGGRPDLAQREFEAALAATHRRLLINQVYYARTYAVQVQNRTLFRNLLEEVLHAGDVMPTERLTNQVAKRRARRYLSQIDELFAP
jgi:hypothetical protein